MPQNLHQKIGGLTAAAQSSSVKSLQVFHRNEWIWSYMYIPIISSRCIVLWIVSILLSRVVYHCTSTYIDMFSSRQLSLSLLTCLNSSIGGQPLSFLAGTWSDHGGNGGNGGNMQELHRNKFGPCGSTSMLRPPSMGEWHRLRGIMWSETERNKSVTTDAQLLWNPVAIRGIVLAGNYSMFQTGPTYCFEPISNELSFNLIQSHSIAPEVFPMCVASPFSYCGHWHIWMACISYIGTWNQPLGRAKAEQRHSIDILVVGKCVFFFL